MVNMTAAQVTALNGILADNGAITNITARNCMAGVVIRTNRLKVVGNFMTVRYLVIAGNGRVMDGHDFADLFF